MNSKKRSQQCLKEQGLSKTQKNRLTRAMKLAELSTCNQRHGAIIMRSGAVISVGVNSYRNSPGMFDVVEGAHISWHAEIAAIRAYKGDLNGTTLYVARINNNGKPMMSKPCINCQKAIKKAGIKKIVYTIDSMIQFN